jgi:hypothetical protein
VAQSRRIETLGTRGACPLCPDRYQIRPTRLNVAECQKATLARLFDHLVGAQQEAYNSVPPLAVVFNLCDRRFDISGV